MISNIKRSILFAISILPFPVLYVISDIISPIIRLVYRRNLVKKNLISSFPNKTKEELTCIEKNFYKQFTDNVFETVKMLSMSEKEMSERMHFERFEELKKYFDNHKFVFIYMGHFGNWEWGASLNMHTRPWAVAGHIYHHVHDGFLNDITREIRARYGAVGIEMNRTFREIINLNQTDKKYIIGFISDQQPKWNSIHHYVDFLNHETAVYTGTEQIARKIDAVLVYGQIQKVHRGYYKMNFIPISDNPSSVPEHQPTDMFFNLLEKDIKHHPELWLWTHKRWTRNREEWLKRKHHNVE